MRQKHLLWMLLIVIPLSVCSQTPAQLKILKAKVAFQQRQIDTLRESLDNLRLSYIYSLRGNIETVMHLQDISDRLDALIRSQPKLMAPDSGGTWRFTPRETDSIRYRPVGIRTL